MRPHLFTLITVLLLVDGAARAQTPAADPLDSALLPLPFSGAQVNTTIDDDSTRGLIVGGHVEEPSPACLPGTRAFVASYDAAGRELWKLSGLTPRHAGCAEPGGCGLFAGLGSLDPAYVVASSVRQAAVDPATGEVLVLSDVTTARAGVECGVRLATGYLVIRLSADGTLLTDDYVGPQPAGPPVPRIRCGEICGPQTRVSDPFSKLSTVSCEPYLVQSQTIIGTVSFSARVHYEKISSPECPDSAIPTFTITGRVAGGATLPGGLILEDCWDVRVYVKNWALGRYDKIPADISISGPDAFIIATAQKQDHIWWPPQGVGDPQGVGEVVTLVQFSKLVASTTTCVVLSPGQDGDDFIDVDADY